jgi:epoxyqueuosine reductase
MSDLDPGAGEAEPALPISAERVKRLARELGSDAVGVAPAAPVASRERFLEWLAAGYAAEMSYLHEHQQARFDPANLLPGARSVVVVGLNYASQAPSQPHPFRVARYAWGEDYHRVLRRLLRRLRSRLRSEYPRLSGRICVDTAPFPDKYWAVRAGLGWQGKHSNVVSREHGSYLLLGSLILDRDCDAYDRPHADFCGTCDACLSACPTAAFPEPYVLDAGRCISYWTIEYKGTGFPVGAGVEHGQWVFGCDECLDACPWNRFAPPARHPSMQRTAAVEAAESGSAQRLDKDEFEQLFTGTALMRAGQAGLRRNLAAARAGVREAGDTAVTHPVEPCA